VKISCSDNLKSEVQVRKKEKEKKERKEIRRKEGRGKEERKGKKNSFKEFRSDERNLAQTLQHLP
jgi:hypothetical protein